MVAPPMPPNQTKYPLPSRTPITPNARADDPSADGETVSAVSAQITTTRSSRPTRQASTLAAASPRQLGHSPGTFVRSTVGETDRVPDGGCDRGGGSPRRRASADIGSSSGGSSGSHTVRISLGSKPNALAKDLMAARP